ncbi:DUF4368 domain-containing protein [bacterium 1xD42-67]|nr:DUF4368 domain-containing protein [bacterium 1xD42-67]
MLVILKNVMNDLYARDTSSKIRAVKQSAFRTGKYVGCYAPIGYRKSSADKHILEIDPVTAPVVLRIFDMRLQGDSFRKIARTLNEEGVPSPRSFYYMAEGRPNLRGETPYWNDVTVKTILRNEVYLGHMVQNKTGTVSYKVHKQVSKPKEDWIKVEHTHEPLVSQEVWDAVQRRDNHPSKGRSGSDGVISLFVGVLKGPECGGNLNFHFDQGNHAIRFFSCQNHNSGLRKCSKTHYIRLEFLERVVLYEVNRLACFANEYEGDFIKAMMGRSAKVTENERARKQRELDGLLARDKELDGLFERLYEDNVSQKISDARFAKMSQRYEQEQGENAKRIKALRLELKKSEGQRMDVDTFLETVRRYTNATEITQRMVAELIDHIDVYHAEKQDGVTTQHITIYYNCIGTFSVPDRRKIPAAEITMGTRKGVAVSYSRSRIAV